MMRVSALGVNAVQPPPGPARMLRLTLRACMTAWLVDSRHSTTDWCNPFESPAVAGSLMETFTFTLAPGASCPDAGAIEIHASVALACQLSCAPPVFVRLYIWASGTNGPDGAPWVAKSVSGLNVELGGGAVTFSTQATSMSGSGVVALWNVNVCEYVPAGIPWATARSRSTCTLILVCGWSVSFSGVTCTYA